MNWEDDCYLLSKRKFRENANIINIFTAKKGKIDGIVYAELAEIPEVVKYTMARHEKRKLSGTKAPSKGKDRLEKEDVEDKDKDGVADKVEESEDKKSGSIKEAETQKAAAKDLKHTAGGAHKGKTAPIRKTLR